MFVPYLSITLLSGIHGLSLILSVLISRVQRFITRALCKWTGFPYLCYSVWLQNFNLLVTGIQKGHSDSSVQLRMITNHVFPRPYVWSKKRMFAVSVMQMIKDNTYYFVSHVWQTGHRISYCLSKAIKRQDKKGARLCGSTNEVHRCLAIRASEWQRSVEEEWKDEQSRLHLLASIPDGPAEPSVCSAAALMVEASILIKYHRVWSRRCAVVHGMMSGNAGCLAGCFSKRASNTVNCLELLVVEWSYLHVAMCQYHHSSNSWDTVLGTQYGHVTWMCEMVFGEGLIQ